jgi:chemotaxis protein methyltransferase CheR
VDAALDHRAMTDLTDIDDADIDALLVDVHDRYQYDFRGYARASLRRRLRVASDKLGCESLAALRARLRDDASAFALLLSQLVVPVSDLFRDPEYFAYLRRDIVPVLRTYPTRKIWIAGCATGEEAYSFAILLREENLLERTIIYATDISAASLRVAESGVYPIDRAPVFTANHARSGARGSLAEHYTAAYQAIAFHRELRRAIVFADHSLATDQVFAEVQIVSCRNVLIYFGRELQDRALGLFAGALSHRGFLGLGPRETVEFSAHARSFEELPGSLRWFRARRTW